MTGVQTCALPIYEFTAYRRKRFHAFKATPEYAAMLADVTSGEHAMDAADVEEFLYQYKAEDYLSRDPDQEPQ